MKATGIVRRIDDLGRVVVPKEIRRTLRIREGDPLEIFIADRDQFIAAAGGGKNYVGKPISRKLESLVEERNTILASKEERGYVEIMDNDTEDYAWEAISPIISEGDAIGAVVLMGKDEKEKVGEVEKKLVMSAAGFLGRQMEQ